MTKFDDVIKQLEKQQPTKSIWVPYLWKPGIFEHTQFDKAIAKFERENP